MIGNIPMYILRVACVSEASKNVTSRIVRNSMYIVAIVSREATEVSLLDS